MSKDETIIISESTLDDNEYTFDITEYGVDTIDISSITSSTIDISSITSSTIDNITLDDTHWADGITWEQIEFEDKMPSVAKIEDMCNDYPALAQAYEKFKTIYAMVHQDWQGKQQDDDQMPF